MAKPIHENEHEEHSEESKQQNKIVIKAHFEMDVEIEIDFEGEFGFNAFVEELSKLHPELPENDAYEEPLSESEEEDDIPATPSGPQFPAPEAAVLK